VDVFFIDWEKPRRILAKAGGSEESAPVSCWRQMLVVNEWSELQTLRLTYPAFTLLFVVGFPRSSGWRVVLTCTRQ
jgi:meckelin